MQYVSYIAHIYIHFRIAFHITVKYNLLECFTKVRSRNVKFWIYLTGKYAFSKHKIHYFSNSKLYPMDIIGVVPGYLLDVKQR